MMLDPDAIDRAGSTLDSDCFFHLPHRWIFAAIVDLHERAVAIDQLTLGEELKLRDQFDDAGGAVYLARLAIEVATAANIDLHAGILLDKAVRRKLIETLSDIVEEASKGSRDPNVLLERTAQRLDRIRENRVIQGSGPEQLSSLIHDVVDQIEHRKNLLKTGFSDLDDLISGFQEGQLIVLAGRRGEGKTSLALSLVRNVATMSGTGVAFFSTRTSKQELTLRLFSAEARVDLKKLSGGQLTDDQWSHLTSAAQRLVNMPVFFDDYPRISMTEIRAQARRLQREHEVGLVIVDAMETMAEQIETHTPEKEISRISRGLKSLAKEVNIPVLALVEMESTQERPKWTDLPESGRFEQEADVVMFIYRPETYCTEDHEGTRLEGIAEIIIAQQRNGPLGTVFLNWNKESATFTPLAPKGQTEAK